MSTLLLMAALVVAPAAAELAENVEDAATTARIETMFLLNRHLSPFNINTTTKDGHVTLTGSVNDEVQKELAEDLAQSARGVKSVDNRITAISTVVGERERRSFRQRVEDKTTEATVRSRLLYHRHFKGIRIGVSCVNGVVTLHGVVSSEDKKTSIGRVTADTKSVKKVINNLTVRPKDPADPVQNVGRQLSDEWVESRVATAVAFNRHLSIRELDVEVDDGVCILTGTVGSSAQREVAGAIAESVQGVKQVQNDIHLHETAPVLEGIDPVEPTAAGPATVEAEPLAAP